MRASIEKAFRSLMNSVSWRQKMREQPVGQQIPWTGWPAAIERSMRRSCTLVGALPFFLSPEAMEAARVDLNRWRQEDLTHYRSVAHFEAYEDTESEYNMDIASASSDESDQASVEL